MEKHFPLAVRKIFAVSLGISALALSGRPVAGQTFVFVAKGTEGLIRAYDKKVSDVRTKIPAEIGTSTACGPVGSGSRTAFYCAETRSIYITNNTLVSVGNDFGPEGVATLIAHEYAHASLDAVQGLTRNVIWTSVVDELQADCVAGVYLRDATPIQLTQAMINRSAQFVQSIGDYLVLEKDWHGTPQMRRTAFLHGYNKGTLAACVASEETNAKKLLKQSSDVLDRQIYNPESELNRLIKWGNTLIRN